LTVIFKKRKPMKEQERGQQPTDMPSDPTLNQEMAEGLNTDDSLPGDTGAEEKLESSDLGRLEAELAESKDRYVRLVAEFENFRKRMARENLELRLTASREIIQALLDVMDDMDRASRQLESEQDIARIREGVGLVFSKFRNVLQQRGLRQMESMNQPFDPELHEAITEIDVPSEEAKGRVVDVVQPGYYLNEKLIRHAKVVVGK
jgi:molecular chaperone GrpE